jgi:cytoskeletal protein CcmA (bactofilin family)
MAQQTLNAGSPPIVWSTVEDAFTKINANFDELYGSIGGPGGVLDFTSLSTDIKPSSSEVYDLGSPTARWRDLYLSGSSLYLGSAQITANLAGILNLPLGTTINGQLIIDPANTAFKTFSVAGQSNIVADSVVDTLTVAAGNSGITLTTNATTDTLTIANSGVIGLAGTLGQIGVSAATGTVTLTNLGVTSLTGTAGGIGVSAATGGITLTNLGVKQIVGTASQIGVTGDGTGIVTITNLAPASPTFRFIVVDGATLQPVAADNISDTLNLISGDGLTITKDTATDTLTFSVNSNLDIRGSVFADDSTMLVDATNGVLRGNFIGSVFADDSTQIIDGNTATIYGNIEATTLRTSDSRVTLGQGAGGDGLQGLESVAIGFVAGGFTQGDYAVAIGSGAGNIGQGNRAVAIGATAGVDQGDYAISIGNGAGYPSAVSGSIAINASGFTLDAPAAGFFVNPIRSTANGRPLMYDTATKELFSSNVLEFIGSRISTSDSSGLTVDVQTTFNTDVTFENEITVNGQVTIGGDLIVNGTTTTINSVTLTVDDKNIELGSTASPTDVTADGGGITLKGTTDKTFNYVNSTGVWTANIGIAATSFTGLAAAATTASTAASVGYMGIPQSATATTATLDISDAGKHIYVNTNSQIITIPANSVVPYPIGTAITFVAGPSATTMTIANNDTMYLVGAGTSGSRTLAAYGTATAIKVAATTWFINGSGLT